MAFARKMPAVQASRPRTSLRLLRVASLVCLLIGLYLLGSFAYGMWHGVSEQQHLNQVWRIEVGTRTPALHSLDRSLQHPLKGIDFAIRVPKLGYDAAVKEGIDSGVLYASPGHYPTTMWPGDPGTVGVAAHNVYWINFPRLSPGDEIDIVTRYGLFRYRVTGSRIVDPDNRTALVPNSNGYHLTLTTCWPLWAGAFATQRYIIFAEQTWPVPVKPGYT
jgi:LPXTG-site transpeptidase (sortase) family protein